MNPEINKLIDKYLEGDERSMATAKYAFEREKSIPPSILKGAVKLIGGDEEIVSNATELLNQPHSLSMLIVGFSKGWDKGVEFGKEVLETKQPSDTESKFMRFMAKTAKAEAPDG